MKDSLISFSTDMVKAILEGRKTMMRMVIEPQPGDHQNDEGYISDIMNRCPYQVGDILWVKETCFASRIAIEVTDIKIEKLQEITEEDAIKEGVRDTFNQQIFYPATYNFKILWDSTNSKKHPWGSNPWVRVISFKRVRED